MDQPLVNSGAIIDNSGAIIDRLRDIAEAYDVIFCDVWGVVHDGEIAFAAACVSLERFRAGGGIVILITNAPRPAGAVMDQIAGFGVPRAAFDAVVSSGDVTVALMARHGAAPFHYIGPPHDLLSFEAAWPGPGPLPPRAPLERAEYVMCTGFVQDETERPEDYDPILQTMRRRGLEMICANPDLVVYRGAKLLPCAGALAARYIEQGGAAIYAGKPHAPIYQMALGAAAAHRGEAVPRDRVLAIGDAMRTDIAGAQAFGVDAILVTNGIHRGDLHGTDGFLDRARYAQFIGGAAPPHAAIADLTW